MKTSESINDIAAALSAAQGELSDVTKDQQGYGYKYADLAAIHHIVRPVLVKHGLSVLQETSSDGDHVQVTTRLMHACGQWIEAGPLSMVAEPKKGLSQAQCVGSTITYARRYALSALLGIASEDDDGSSGRDSTETKGAVDELKKLASEQWTFAAHEMWAGMSRQEKAAVWPLLDEKEQQFVREAAQHDSNK
jgi:hypothetical protein